MNALQYNIKNALQYVRNSLFRRHSSPAPLLRLCTDTIQLNMQ